MRLSISNIGWTAELDEAVYVMMGKNNFEGLEIAPTRIFPDAPYSKLEQASSWAREIKERFGFIVPSMQSIWFGRQEKIFGTLEEREALIEYTKSAIDFAERIGCNNLVFGCPRNRNLPQGAAAGIAVAFFKELGDYAVIHNTVIGMEANPPIYHTNYINDTLSALQLIEEVGSEGFKLNLDVGTMIHNGESADELIGMVKLINHVHISEPGLKPIEKRQLHCDLKTILDAEKYTGFVSIEMGKTAGIRDIEVAVKYVKGIFG